MSAEHVNRLLAHVAAMTGLAGLALDEENRCGLKFDDQLGVEIELAGGDLRLTAVVGSYPPELELPALRELASANLGWAGTGGATLAANTDRRLVALQLREAAEGLDTDRFVRLLEGFVNTAERWAERLAHLRPDTPPEAPSPLGIRV
jgi:hypothetical protein